MNYDNKIQVVLLATDKEPIKGDLLLRHLWKGTDIETKTLWQYEDTIVIDEVKQYTTLNGSFRDCYTSFKVSHLYILSSEEIKEGDWIYNKLDSKPIRWFKENFPTLNNPVSYDYKKIIATNNPDLNLPAPTDSFVQEFIEEFNKGNVIKEVMVEYYEDYITIGQAFHTHKEFNGYKLRLAPDNTITCRKIEITEEDYHKDLTYLLNSFRSILKYYPLKDKEVALESFENIIDDYKKNYNPPTKKEQS